MTESQKQQVSKQQKALWQDPKYRKRILAAHQKALADHPERRAARSKKFKVMWQTEDYKTRVIEGMKKVWREDPRLKRRQSEIAKELWRKGTFANRPCVPCPEEKKKRLAAASKRVWKDPGLRGKLLKGCQTKWRREAPKAERLLHAQLRKHHIPYQTQAILATLYVVDILLPKAAVVIECDEKSHTWGKFRKKDKKRDATLKNLGFTVIRIPTAKILTDPAAVFQKYLGGLALVE